MRHVFMWLGVVVAMCGASPQVLAAPVSESAHSSSAATLPIAFSSSNLIHQQIALELVGDNGWHPVNPASGNPDDPHGLPAFTDGVGPLNDANGIFTGLLNDFPTPGQPTKRVQYAVNGGTIGEVRIFTGNENGKDGRIFSTTVVSYSTDGGETYLPVGYFQSDPSGTLNNLENNAFGATVTRIFDDEHLPLASGATHVLFELYAVDNTGGQVRDPFDDENPFTLTDDGLTAAFVSPIVWEIDVFGLAIRGDMNGDAAVDNEDISGFVLALIDPDAYQAQFVFSDGAWRGDVNASGSFDNEDISPFVGLLLGGAAAVPEPGTAVLALVAVLSLARFMRRRPNP
jgi:hypothetical protein